MNSFKVLAGILMYDAPPVSRSISSTAVNYGRMSKRSVPKKQKPKYVNKPYSHNGKVLRKSHRIHQPGFTNCSQRRVNRSNKR